VISEALGHASAAFTMDVYGHIIEGMQEGTIALPEKCYEQGCFKTIMPTMDILALHQDQVASKPA
tara:strand:- start:205 stop:399 length:195 start_codon:yes stop_codon:yes gene_type:complete